MLEYLLIGAVVGLIIGLSIYILPIVVAKELGTLAGLVTVIALVVVYGLMFIVVAGTIGG